jgi:hypothetical protein
VIGIHHTISQLGRAHFSIKPGSLPNYPEKKNGLSATMHNLNLYFLVQSLLLLFQCLAWMSVTVENRGGFQLTAISDRELNSFPMMFELAQDICRDQIFELSTVAHSIARRSAFLR